MRIRLAITSLLLGGLLLAGCAEFHWITPMPGPNPDVAPAVVPEVIPEEEVGELEPDPIPVPCLLIKGNISSDGRKLYHVEGMRNYDQVKINEAVGEMFFCSVEEAEAAGWVRAGN